MEYTIEYDEAAEDLEELDTRLNALYSTRAGDQPMDREFGIDTSEVIGMPPETAKNTLAVEIVEKTNKYIPEVEVSDVTFSSDIEGRLVPVIHITTNDDLEEEEEDDE